MHDILSTKFRSFFNLLEDLLSGLGLAIKDWLNSKFYARVNKLVPTWRVRNSI